MPKNHPRACTANPGERSPPNQQPRSKQERRASGYGDAQMEHIVPAGPVDRSGRIAFLIWSVC